MKSSLKCATAEPMRTETGAATGMMTAPVIDAKTRECWPSSGKEHFKEVMKITSFFFIQITY